MSTLIDISWPISSDMTTYKDRNDVTFEQYKRFEQDGVRETRWSASLHTGTHVDAPAHFLGGGEGMESYDLSQLCGSAYVIDCTHIHNAVTQSDLADKHIPQECVVLVKTRNSNADPTAPFDYNFVYIAADAAAYLASCGVRGVGIDYLGIERSQPGHETHKQLLEAHIPIIEGLRLAHVAPGMYGLWCLPLSMPGRDAAPARVILTM